jgi:acetyltransferase
VTSQDNGVPAAIARWPLPDGEEAILRHITPDDLAIETTFVDGLSAETGYNRLFSTRHPDETEIRRWTTVDPAREVALVVSVGRGGTERMLAVGRYVRDDAGPDAEFAVVVGDDWKRCGLGARLIDGLVESARRTGVRRLYGETLSTNVGMLALGRKLGFSARRVLGDSMVTRLALTLNA